MKGYLKNPVATDHTIKDGWLYTGDFGKHLIILIVYTLERHSELEITVGHWPFSDQYCHFGPSKI